MRILAVESSCDETAAAVVEDGRKVLSNELYSQIGIHELYGGVVPEIASRAHADKLPHIVPEAVKAAGGFENIDAVAATRGPGLVGALLCGLSYAKSLALAADVPFIAVDHMAGHVSGVLLSHPDLEPPFVCLVVSGGHTEIILVRGYTEYTVMGRTRDDAAGEAVDKTARLLGYPYPGGPNLEKAALSGDPEAFTFPKSFRGADHLDFSFSGPKTAVVNLVHKMKQQGRDIPAPDVAASFLRYTAETLAENTFEAAGRAGVRRIALAGGVSANRQLREVFESRAAHEGLHLYLPKLEYCTDNAAMIASAAYYAYEAWGADGLDTNADPGADLERYAQ